MTTSVLDSIKGIGPKTTEELLKHFGSVDEIKNATPVELQKVVGNAKAALLVSFFR
jgi:excinuclease ABC subunit C